MNDKELWIATIEAKVLENFELNDDGSELQFVECLYLAGSADEIIAEINQVLPAVGLKLTDVSRCCIYKPEDWHGEDAPMFGELIQQAAVEALATNKLTFGPFTSSNFFKE